MSKEKMEVGSEEVENVMGLQQHHPVASGTFPASLVGVISLLQQQRFNCSCYRV